MKRFAILITVFLMLLLSVTAHAVNYDEGIDYKAIHPAQSTDDPSRVEVVEVFWYGCPHCYRFEPVLGPWVKALPKDVDFKRRPAVFRPVWELHARAYFTASILDEVENTHASFFHKMHVENKTLNTLDKLTTFYASKGIDKDLFKKTFNSFVVNTKVARAKSVIGKYGITGVPSVVVEGKYLVTGGMAGSHENMLSIIDFLIAKERAKK
ncbi:MAG: disulfide bond formation protein DsbA [Cycloclasticus sp. symbiont of Poecilosclerida sp. M]|nr:MAG: disulfide bond formation protein DsbA [Cycloclasticus sp. symbiont of Poecilosclerida sp. M]